MECLAAKYGSCRTTNCKNPGPHMICFAGSDEATESRTPSGQAEFDLLYTEDQIIKWCKRWWQDDAWREEQKKSYGCDTAHLLRGVADMIEGI